VPVGVGAGLTQRDTVLSVAFPTLGDVIRQQRELQELSLRELARLTGISNPYLSQIERNLREPSMTVVNAIADALDMTTERLYSAAGIPDDEGSDGSDRVLAAIDADPLLRPAQRRALAETYRAFVVANGGPRPRRRASRPIRPT
jgi:transcriptional regulator with XRE-family HTH domain